LPGRPGRVAGEPGRPVPRPALRPSESPWPNRGPLLRRPVSAALPGGDGRTDYRTCCCCFARPAPAALPGGNGLGRTDYQTCCCGFARPAPAALPGGNGLGRTDYRTCCCCFARLGSVVLPDGDGWTDYQTGCCCSAGRSLLRMEAGPFLRWTMHGVHPSRFRGQRAWLPLSSSQQA
jgi:hypothetical protein